MLLISVLWPSRTMRRRDRLYRLATRLLSVASPRLAMKWTLPPHESRHVAGTALDVRPVEANPLNVTFKGTGAHGCHIQGVRSQLRSVRNAARSSSEA